MVKYLIIDDEPIAHSIIESYCENLKHLTKVGNCYNAFEAIDLLSTTNAEIIFLDINMPNLSGFDFLKTLRNPPEIIVTTAYEEFALEGYSLNICDYLLKPFSFDRFLKAVHKAIENINKSKPNSQTRIEHKTKKSIFVKGNKNRIQIHLDSISYLEAYGNYTKIFTNENYILSHEKISNLETELPKDDFIRVHKSYIISKEKIKLITDSRILIGEFQVPIGQTYKLATKNLFK